MISNTSRYATNVLAIVSDPEGKVRLTVIYKEPVENIVNFTEFQWQQGDRIDLVAIAYYGDEQLWWMIADANPEILDWNALSVGTFIRIPSV